MALTFHEGRLEWFGYEMRLIFQLTQDGDVRFDLTCEIDQGDSALTQYEQVSKN